VDLAVEKSRDRLDRKWKRNISVAQKSVLEEQKELNTIQKSHDR